MKTDKKNIDPRSDKELIKSFPEIDLPYSKSKEEVWKELSTQINFEEEPAPRSIHLAWVKYAVAASIVLLLGITGFLRYSTTTVYCPKGEHLSILLPDKSEVELNANSTVTYHPYWWKVSRKITFAGEGFFTITKGSKFEIESKYGKTIILGTSFNIYARDKQYQVTCFTGRVKVVSNLTSDDIVLLPKDHAEINPNGKIQLEKGINVAEKTMWRKDLFFFTATPIDVVFREIERQYNVNIVEKGKFDLIYTGNFKKEGSVEDVLNLVCLPLGLKFVKGPNNNYIITQTTP